MLVSGNQHLHPLLANQIGLLPAGLLVHVVVAECYTALRLDDDHDILSSDDIELHWVSDADSDCGANVSKYLPPSKVNEQNRRQRRRNWEKVHMLFAERLATRQEAVCNCTVLNRQVLLVSASGKSPAFHLINSSTGIANEIDHYSGYKNINSYM